MFDIFKKFGLWLLAATLVLGVATFTSCDDDDDDEDELPTLTGFAATAAEPSDNAVVITVTATTVELPEGVTVAYKYKVDNGDATEITMSGTSTTVSIAQGDAAKTVIVTAEAEGYKTASQTITVPAKASEGGKDTEEEGEKTEEEKTMTLTVKAKVGEGEETTVADGGDVEQGATVTFTAAKASGDETETVTFTYEVAVAEGDGAATSKADGTKFSETNANELTIAEEQATGKLTITVKADGYSDKTFTIKVIEATKEEEGSEETTTE